MLSWEMVCESFRVLSGRSVLSMREMKRRQDITDDDVWLSPGEPPLVLLFVSHRWDTLTHPDPNGIQLRAIQQFLCQICTLVEATLVDPEERLQLVPALDFEGMLQASEVVRRMFGHGIFKDSTPTVAGRDAKAMVRRYRELYQDDREAFHFALAGSIGVWFDYCCMPQKPHNLDEEVEFRRSLNSLDDLVMSSTLVALRCANDDYPLRGWCASEFFLASGRSFQKGIFLDIDRIESGQKVAIAREPRPDSTVAPEADTLLVEAYRGDLKDFENACEQWCAAPCTFVDIALPDAWSSYRFLHGNSSLGLDLDPNPFRRVMEGIRSLETALIRRWLMSPNPCSLDIGQQAGDFLVRHELRTAEPQDLVYLALLLGSHGWIEAFRPLFREAVARYLTHSGLPAMVQAQDSCVVRLEPLISDQRAHFQCIKPNSAEVWHLRLALEGGTSDEERQIVEALKQSLQLSPPRFAFVIDPEGREVDYTPLA